MIKAAKRRNDILQGLIEHGNIAGEFLAESERSGILKMGAPDFHDIRKSSCLRIQSVAQLFHGGNKNFDDNSSRGDRHGCWESVIRRLRHVDVIIRVDRLLAAFFAAGDGDGAVRNDLVRIHVALRA